MKHLGSSRAAEQAFEAVGYRLKFADLVYLAEALLESAGTRGGT